MENSLFKKNEITKKEAGKIVGGTDTYEQATIGMKQTVWWHIILGVRTDSEFASDHQDFQEPQ